jgi:glycosyltransferase involved in cell wall biosynthesis
VEAPKPPASDRLSILYLTSVDPFGPDYGARIRVANIGRLLQRLGPVTLVVALPEGTSPGWTGGGTGGYESLHAARIVPEPLAGLRNRVRFETDPAFMNVYFSAVAKNDRAAVRDMIQSHDVTWVHSIRTADEFRISRWPRSVLDIDDLPSRSYRSRRHGGGHVLRNILDRRMSLVWRRRERALFGRFDVLCVCSEDDRRYLGGGPRVRVVPNGFLLAGQPVRDPASPPRLGFIGTFEYPPNRAGVEWFIDKVWPIVKRSRPEARLRLAGAESDAPAAASGPDIDRLGYLEDPAAEFASWTAMIVPILTAAGTRVKIAEAFGRMCPVVSTSLGAFGYAVKSGEDLLIADRPGAFAGACLRLIESPEEGRRLARNARAKFLDRWTWDAIARPVGSAVSSAAKDRSE